MIIDNSALGFSSTQNDCNCQSEDFCLLVSKEDNPTWQVAATCGELTGGEEKQPCESNQIGLYTDDFYTDVPLNTEVIITDTYIQFIWAQSAANTVRTADLFLLPNTCYFLRYSVTSYIGGYIQTKNGIQRNANGTYSEVYCTDEDGFLQFTYGPDDNPEVLTSLILSNIFIGCIRYSSLYTVSGLDEEDASLFRYISQTAFEKTGSSADAVDVTLNNSDDLIVGKQYTFCITIYEAVSGTVTVTIGDDTFDFTTNGRHCETVTFAQTTPPNEFKVTLSTDFVGKVSDITINMVPEFKAELFDCEGNVITDGLDITQINDTIKIEIGADVEDGCYNIGIASSCDDYKR